MAVGTFPPIAEMIVLLIDRSSGTTMKSNFGQSVFRLSAAVSSLDALGKLNRPGSRKRPSNEMWASPASSSIIASSKRRLSQTCQDFPTFPIEESYHRCLSPDGVWLYVQKAGFGTPKTPVPNL